MIELTYALGSIIDKSRTMATAHVLMSEILKNNTLV